MYLHFNSKVWKVLLIVLGQHWKRLDLGAVWIRKCPVLLSIKFQYLLISSVHCVFIEGFKKLATDGSAVLIWALPQHSTFGEKHRLLFYYLVYYLFAAETKHLTKRTEKCLSWFSAPWQGRCGDRTEVEGHTASTWEVESKGFWCPAHVLLYSVLDLSAWKGTARIYSGPSHLNQHYLENFLTGMPRGLSPRQV